MKYVKREDQILMAGSGTSRLTEDMFEDGKSELHHIYLKKFIDCSVLNKPNMSLFLLNEH